MVQKRHILDAMSKHVGTTSGSCFAAFWDKFYVEDLLDFIVLFSNMIISFV